MNRIIHVSLNLDASRSMRDLANQVVQVSDSQVASLAKQSKAQGVEIRATAYSFHGPQFEHELYDGSPRLRMNCAFFDRDVLRMPSLKDSYKVCGSTPLIDAALKNIEDLEDTSTLYGDHTFLLFIITDGEEACSKHSPETLRRRITALPDNWTVAVLVPNVRGKMAAEAHGFPLGNIEIWDPTEKGLEELKVRLEDVSTAYVTKVSSDKNFRGTDSVFTLSKKAVAEAVTQGDLEKVSEREYTVARVNPEDFVDEKLQISAFVTAKLGVSYERGQARYQLSKRETIQGTKDVLIRDKDTHEVFKGQAARKMIGLPTDGSQMRFSPVDSEDYDIFVQSSQTNRHLVEGTDLIYFH